MRYFLWKLITLAYSIMKYVARSPFLFISYWYFSASVQFHFCKKMIDESEKMRKNWLMRYSDNLVCNIFFPENWSWRMLSDCESAQYQFPSQLSSFSKQREYLVQFSCPINLSQILSRVCNTTYDCIHAETSSELE